MSIRRLALFAFPLLLLGGLVWLVARGDLLTALQRGTPPVEELTVDRVRLAPGEIELDLVNGGPDPVTLAQVMVDDAFWTFRVRPGHTVPRLARVTVEIPYPWIEGEPHHITLVTSNGITFDHEIAVATATPAVDRRYFLTFSLIGLYVGVLPVAIGLLWLPFLRQLDRHWIHFALALTGGLLVYLALEALHEALEVGERVAGAFQGTGLVGLAALGSWLLLTAFAGTGRGARDGGAGSHLRLAFLIALGIGLHNLGEGLAIGAAYAQGAVTLGAFLVIGFMVHNTTEGLGIVAPVAQDKPSLGVLALAGLLAGGPTVIGSWLGGLAYSPMLATVALAIGAGAIVQVLGVLYRVVARESEGGVWTPLNALGVGAGLVVMYGTGLLVG